VTKLESHHLIITVEAKFNSTVQLVKTLKKGILQIKYGHRFFGCTKGVWTGREQKHHNSGWQLSLTCKSLTSLDLQVTATGNKYK